MNINIKQTVGDLKKNILQNYTGLHPSKFRVYYRDAGGWTGDEELKYPKKVLHMVGVKMGDELHIEERE